MPEGATAPTPITSAMDEPVDPEEFVGGRPVEKTSQHRRGRPSPHDGCPYLAADGRGWRSIAADRAHRCTAVSPPAVLALDKQRRLCLVLEHTGCATYQAAVAAHHAPVAAGPSSSAAGNLGPEEPTTGSHDRAAIERVTRWAITRSTPVVLDHGRLPPAVTMLSPFRRGGQLALGSLMVLALSAVLASRLGTPDGAPAGAVASSSAGPSATAEPTATPRVTPRPSPSGSATVGPTATPGATPSLVPTASPVTYTVRSGDTLVRIASQFGTTAAAIASANGITDPGRIAVGQVLVIPAPPS